MCYSAPTTGLIGISKDLKKLGIDVEAVVKTALPLHRFSYNGFDQTWSIIGMLMKLGETSLRLLAGS